MLTNIKALQPLVEALAGSVVQRGTNVPPIEALSKLAEAAYEAGVKSGSQPSEEDTTRMQVVGPIAREIVALFNGYARKAGLSGDLAPPHDAITFDVYRLLSDVYSAGKGHPFGLVLDVRERAEALVQSFYETYKMAPDSTVAVKFLRELFVNALLEARETAHHVDWDDPAQVELYTIAVEAESKRYEEINLRIAAAEKAARNPFADFALQDIPTWFDELKPGPPDGQGPHYLAHNDPLFAAALNRAFAIGVQSAKTTPWLRGDGVEVSPPFTELRVLVETDAPYSVLQEWLNQALAYAGAHKIRALALTASDAEVTPRAIELTGP